VSVIAVLIGFSLLVAVAFLFAFFWAVKSGQFDDKYTPSVRMLFDDMDNQKIQEKSNTNLNKENS
jgi:cbb3-type cytochrome oxidase maturation protein